MRVAGDDVRRVGKITEVRGRGGHGLTANDDESGGEFDRELGGMGNDRRTEGGVGGGL